VLAARLYTSFTTPRYLVRHLTDEPTLAPSTGGAFLLAAAGGTSRSERKLSTGDGL
jgi:hypothetical protein